MKRSLALLGLLLPAWAAAADRITLSPQTWQDAAPHGKEADAIYGDIVLRSDRLHAVIGRPAPDRNANMTVRNVGGCLIDLTTRHDPSDQLSAFYPGGKSVGWEGDAAEDQRGQAQVSYSVRAAAKKGRPSLQTTYTLADGQNWLLVETEFANDSAEPLEVALVDELRADNSFSKTPNGKAPLFWVYDKWFDQAYGVVADGVHLAAASDARTSTLSYQSGEKQAVALAPGGKLKLTRRVFPGRSLLAVRGVAGEIAALAQNEVKLLVRDAAGRPLAGASASVERDGAAWADGRTGEDGRLAFLAPDGRFTATIASLGSGQKKLDLKPGENVVELPAPGVVAAKITDERGGPIPCKVAFRGQGETKDPAFGNDSCEHGVRNLYYSHDGQFTQPLEPGQYDVTISHGPEYDAVYTTVQIQRGQATPLAAALRRVVDSTGWISSDFHSHSSPSGDNTSSQLGRVLNLLCEHIEFAPCTEHNRVSTYDPHLARLGVAKLMATCSGIELTGSPLPLNHQNAFPLVLKERTQDGGGPQTDVSPEVQIGRLALWDSRSEKLVQQNHPDIGNLFFDKNGDGRPDKGFAEGLPFIDVIEVHPPRAIFDPPTRVDKGNRYNNTIFNWLQVLNQGWRVPGVVNTDAHYNFHGSGFLRIYVHSPTDDPAEVKVADVVREAEKGHVIMTSGPLLTVSATSEAGGQRQTALCGDDLAAPGGKAVLHVKVQCANWLDVDRVQVFVNGRPDEKLNFRRETHSDRFGGGVVKFEQQIPLELAADAHLVVAAAGEQRGLGPVMGPDHGKDLPIAVSNPIYVDVDGGGFKANGDTLGAPLPVKEGGPAN